MNAILSKHVKITEKSDAQAVSKSQRHLAVGVTILCLGLVLETGCTSPDGTPNNTATGALAGGLLGGALGALGGGRHAGGHALFGALAGAVAGGLIGNMIDRDQQRRLRDEYPQTYVVIQHNDSVLQQQQQPGYVPPPPAVAPSEPVANAQPGAPAAAPDQNQGLIPLSIEDVKAMTAAGVKPEAIIKELESSKSVYSQQDIAAIQQANPAVDSSVIDYMRNHSS